MSCHWPPKEVVKKVTWFNGALFRRDVLLHVSLETSPLWEHIRFPGYLFCRLEGGTTTTKHLFEQEAEAEWK